MSGFYQGVAGGNGKLIVSALKSPNFNPDEGTGWSIDKTGDATFYSISLPNIESGTKVTFSSTAPSDPANGDVWYDTAQGLEAQVFSGTTSTWVPYQIGAQAIAANAIGTDQIADNAITNALMADSAIEEQNIADGAVTATQISAAAGILASQVGFTAQQIGGLNITVSDTQPSNPNVGDLWIKSVVPS